jgi:hypothetical protein
LQDGVDDLLPFGELLMQIVGLVDPHDERFVRQPEQTLSIDKRSLKFLNLRTKMRNFLRQ